MLKNKIQLTTFICFFVIAITFAQKQSYNIGLLLDNRSENLNPLLIQLQEQIKSVVGEDAIINFSQQNRLVNDYNLETAEKTTTN